MEYSRSCGEKWYAALEESEKRKVTLHYGDQSNEDDLRRVIKETNVSLFDIIVDDGGHGMTMQQVSMSVLFPFVSPGG